MTFLEQAEDIFSSAIDTLDDLVELHGEVTPEGYHNNQKFLKIDNNNELLLQGYQMMYINNEVAIDDRGLSWSLSNFEEESFFDFVRTVDALVDKYQGS